MMNIDVDNGDNVRVQPGVGGPMLNTLLRLLSYILTRLTVFAIIAILIILAIFIGYDWANIYVITNEGLAQRAETVLKGEDTSELIKFYTQDFLDRDPLLSRAPYEKFDISNYDHRIRIKMLWVWPWENKTKVKVEEIINGIEGSVKDEESGDIPIPPWDNGEKIVILEKDGRWKIDNVLLTKPIKLENENEKSDDRQED